MSKRPRSPNYPSVSLAEAVSKVRQIAAEIGQNPADRETVARSMGYRSLSGASGSLISALKKYALLEGRGEDVRVSDLSMAILHPHNQEERAAAIRRAALEPELFGEINGRFDGGAVSDELLRNYLVRNGFTASALDGAISAYKDTMEFVDRECGDYDSARPDQQEIAPMHVQQTSPQVTPPVVAQDATAVEVGGIGFKGVGFVKIMATPDLDPQKALTMAESVIRMMRDELKQRRPEPVAEQDGKIDEGEENA